jgi:hypothetical protein
MILKRREFTKPSVDGIKPNPLFAPLSPEDQRYVDRRRMSKVMPRRWPDGTEMTPLEERDANRADIARITSLPTQKTPWGNQTLKPGGTVWNKDAATGQWTANGKPWDNPQKKINNGSNKMIMGMPGAGIRNNRLRLNQGGTLGQMQPQPLVQPAVQPGQAPATSPLAQAATGNLPVDPNNVQYQGLGDTPATGAVVAPPTPAVMNPFSNAGRQRFMQKYGNMFNNFGYGNPGFVRRGFPMNRMFNGGMQRPMLGMNGGGIRRPMFSPKPMIGGMQPAVQPGQLGQPGQSRFPNRLAKRRFQLFGNQAQPAQPQPMNGAPIQQPQNPNGTV